MESNRRRIAKALSVIYEAAGLNYRVPFIVGMNGGTDNYIARIEAFRNLEMLLLGEIAPREELL